METTKSINITAENIEDVRVRGGYIFKITHPELNDGEPIELRVQDKDYDDETRFYAGEQLSQDWYSQHHNDNYYELVIFSEDAEDFILSKFDFISEDDLPDCCKLYTIEELKKYFPDYVIEDAQLDKLKDDNYSTLCYNRHYAYYVRKSSKPGFYELDICDC